MTLPEILSSVSNVVVTKVTYHQEGKHYQTQALLNNYQIHK